MTKRQTLEKSYKAHWVWAIALGSSIGWGAFVQPANWMNAAGPVGAIIGFIIGALLMMIIAVSYGFLIESFPVSGGEFAYAYVGLGRTHAFISGWFLTLGYICIVALNASAFALMFKFLFPNFIENLFLYQAADWNVYGTEVIIGSLILMIFGYMNVKGTSFSGQMQFIFTSIMVVSVVAITILIGVQPSSGPELVKPLFTPEKSAFSAIVSIIAIAPWAYVGFDNVPQIAEEFKFSSSKAFRLIILALIFAAVLYSLMIFTTAMGQPWQQLVSENLLWGTGTVVQNLVGTTGMIILVTAVSMGIFTGLNGFIVSSSRLLFAMSRAEIIPSVFSKLHPKYHTPHMSIIFTILVSLVAPWFGREVLVWVVDMSSIGVTIAYFYTSFTAFKLFKWRKDQTFNPMLNKVSPIKKAISGLGVLVSLTFLALLLIPGSPAFLGIQSRIALLIWVVLGALFYIIKRKNLYKLSDEEMNYLILGNKKIQIK
jgi:amino acid transporter